MESLSLVLAAVAALSGFAAALLVLMVYLRQAPSQQGPTYAQISELLRAETERVRQAHEEQARGLRQELGERIERGMKSIDDRAAAIAAKLDEDIAKMGREANQSRDALRAAIDARLESAAAQHAASAKELREEVANNLTRFGQASAEMLAQIGALQKERLDLVAEKLRVLVEKHEAGQDALRQSVESRLDALRVENSAKLDEMRRTVDEKLQSTLEQRLGESFNRVVEQLERVHNGIGEMRTLAAGVGDLKKVLSNVSVRGAFGEIRLGLLLEQILSPEQYVENAVVKTGSSERVEFAIKLPGRDTDNEVLLPIDAKFPQEDYLRLLAAADAGDTDAVAEAGKALETRIKLCAKTIADKYINSPRTTDFAILFLPIEGLYAEVLRRPGLFEQLQRDYHVTLAGPTTLNAFLNALQMGFRSVAISKRTSEVWEVLGAVRNEFSKYDDVVKKLTRSLETAKNTVENLGTRTRAMSRKLRDIEVVGDQSAQKLLGFDPLTELVETEDAEEADA